MSWKILLFLLLNMSIGAAYADTFALTSPAVFNHASLPNLYTCVGKDLSPPLSWAGSSEKAQTFALILSDPDAPGGVFYHWILYNIPREVHELSAGVKELPVGTMVGQNSWAKTQYNGPCPPKGAIHHYLFTLYAIDTKLNLTSGADYKKVMQAMRSHILEETNFTAIYEIDNEKHS